MGFRYLGKRMIEGSSLNSLEVCDTLPGCVVRTSGSRYLSRNILILNQTHARTAPREKKYNRNGATLRWAINEEQGTGLGAHEVLREGIGRTPNSMWRELAGLLAGWHS